MFGLRILDLASHLINFLSHFKKIESSIKKNYLVEANGVEPMTLCVQGRCSSQLSYAPDTFHHHTSKHIIMKAKGKEAITKVVHIAKTKVYK